MANRRGWADLASFEAAARRQGMPGYRVVRLQNNKAVPVNPKAQHVPILYAVPEGSAQLGLDLGQVAQRMASKLLARETGQPIASATFPLITSPENKAQAEGVVISSAMLSKASAKTAAASAAGYVAGVIQVEALFREACVCWSATVHWLKLPGAVLTGWRGR